MQHVCVKTSMLTGRSMPTNCYRLGPHTKNNYLALLMQGASPQRRPNHHFSLQEWLHIRRFCLQHLQHKSSALKAKHTILLMKFQLLASVRAYVHTGMPCYVNLKLKTRSNAGALRVLLEHLRKRTACAGRHDPFISVIQAGPASFQDCEMCCWFQVNLRTP